VGNLRHCQYSMVEYAVFMPVIQSQCIVTVMEKYGTAQSRLRDGNTKRNDLLFYYIILLTGLLRYYVFSPHIGRLLFQALGLVNSTKYIPLMSCKF
jgi:hypothetical protein